MYGQFGETLTAAELRALLIKRQELGLGKLSNTVSLSKSEFTIALLHCVGKVTDEDLAQIFQHFDKLDRQGDTRLSYRDVQRDPVAMDLGQ